MADFTATEKMKIRRYLGYSGGYRDSTISLESMMTVVANQVDEAAYARELLVSIAAVDTALASSGSSSSATYGAVKKVDEIEFHPITSGSGSTSTLSGVEYGEVLIERLRALFGIELAGRYFRSSPSTHFFFGPR